MSVTDYKTLNETRIEYWCQVRDSVRELVSAMFSSDAYYSECHVES